MMKGYGVLVWVLLISYSLGALADEKSVYDFSWLDKDKKIYVLQNRKFRKEGKLYVGLGGAKTLSGAFIDAYGGSFRAGYFFKEDWGLEFVYGKFSGDENETAKGVKSQGTVPFYRKVDSYMAGMLWWSPFYSKINTFNQIFYYDWMFGAGLTRVSTLDNRKLFEPGEPKTTTAEETMGVIWSSALRFYLNQSWSLRLDFTALHYNADRMTSDTEGEKDMFSVYDFGVGLMFAF